MEDRQRLRLKLPDGAEFEAEGTPDFVRSERQEFLAGLQPKSEISKTPQTPTRTIQEPTIAFVNIPIFEEFTGQNIYINLRMVERTECHMVVYNCFAFG